MKMSQGIRLVFGMVFLAFGSTATAQTVQWINHLDLIPGDTSVTQTSYTSTFDWGLVVQSSTLGENDSYGGGKVVSKALQMPSSPTIIGVRICYLLSNMRTYVSQVRLAQAQSPDFMLVLLDSRLPHDNPGPVCIDSDPAFTPIDPSLGTLLLSLRVNFGDTTDRITIRSVGIITN